MVKRDSTMPTSELVFMTSPWASGHIRGVQIAERLGAKCDPKESISADSIFVFIKLTPNINLARMYIDIVDAHGLLTSLTRFPDAKIIAISNLAKDFIANRVYNDVIVIPEHHCNFENITRENRLVKTVGFIGYTPNFGLDPMMVRDELAKIGLNFIWDVNFQSRQDVCDFYKKIDIQLTFRPKSPIALCAAELKNPLKLENAGSFMIPTVACAEPTYVDEFDNCFYPAENIDEIVEACKCLKDNDVLYRSLAKSCYDRALDYRIEKILPLYRQLENWKLRKPTGESLVFSGYDMGSTKLFQVKSKDKIVGDVKLITRTIRVGGKDYRVGGVREFKVLKSSRMKGVGRLLFSDLVTHAERVNIDMLAGFSRDGALEFFLKCGCKLLDAVINSQSMFYYPINSDCKPVGKVDLMGTTW